MPRKKKKHSSEKLIASIIFVALAAVIIVAMYFLFPTMRQRVEEADQSARNAANSQVVAKNVTAPMAGDGLLTLHFISVGQADSIFIEFPTGNNMLIDASEKSTADTVISYVSALGVSAIDYVLLTHQDADHAGGMADIFKAFEVKNALRPSVYSTYKSYALPTDFNIGYESSCPSSTATYYNYLKAVYEEPGCAWEAFNKDSDIDFVATSGGTEYRCTLDFLTPTAAVGSIKYKKENNFSPIMILEYGGVKIMLTGDAEKEVEQELIAYYGDDDLDVDFLKVGHHGSKTSSTDAFIKKIKPETSIISCGLAPEKQKYCPWQVTLDTLTANGSAIYRTDLQGNIVLKIKPDGSSSISTERVCSDYNAILTGYSG